MENSDVFIRCLFPDVVSDNSGVFTGWLTSASSVEPLPGVFPENSKWVGVISQPDCSAPPIFLTSQFSGSGADSGPL